MQSNVNLPDMSHLEIINKLIKKNDFKTYLEVGIKDGHCFFNVDIIRKVGVDPNISFLLAFNNLVANELIRLRCLVVPHIDIYNITSDDYFQRMYIENFDMIFIDGMHTREQVYRDIDNSLKILKPGGKILVHDTNPTNKLVANPTAPIVSDWSGDVWKAIVDLRCKRNDLAFMTVDIPFGLTMITLNAEEKQDLLDDKNKCIEFEEFKKNRKELLNLVPKEEFLSIIGGNG